VIGPLEEHRGGARRRGPRQQGSRRSPRVAGAKLYITNQGSASITVIDQSKLAVDTVIDLTKMGFSPNAKPHHVVVEKDGSFWYATLNWRWHRC